MKIYISGKISGLPICEVQSKFHEAHSRLQAVGFFPVSPLENGCESDEWYDQMMACFPLIRECEAIYLLKDWRESPGALIEHAFAKRMGKFVIEQL